MEPGRHLGEGTVRPAPRRITRTALRCSAVATATAVLLAACSGADPSPHGNTASRAAGPPPATSMTTPVASEHLADVVEAAGFDAGTGWVASRTRSSVRVVDGHTYLVTHQFPNGAIAEMTYHLSAGRGAEPAAGVSVTGREQGERYLLTLTYAIDADDLPADLRAQVTDGIPTSAAAAGPPGDGTRLVVAQAAYVANEAPGTIDVVVDGVISQAKEAYIDTWADRADSKLAGGSWEVFKAGGKVWDAVGASDMVGAALAKLDAMQKCAENPTNPLTRQGYEKDPAAQQKVTDQLKALRGEIKESAAALFVQLLADTGSSLVASAKWLGFIVAPATNYIKETLNDTITERVREAEALVPKCNRQSYAISGSSPSIPSGIRYTGTACSLEKRFTVTTTGDYIGSFSFRPNSETGGTFAYTGKVGNAPLKVTGSGAYSVTVSGDASTGSLDFDFQSTVHIPQVGPQSGGGPVHLTLKAIAPCTG